MIRSVIKGSNAQLIAEIAPLWIDPTGLVLDVTYGRGLWWTVYKPRFFKAHDMIVDGVDFRHLPEMSNSVDTVAYDPPYISTGSRKTSTVPDFYERYGLGNIKGFKALINYNLAGLKEATRVVKYKGIILVKAIDWVESGKLHLGFDAMLHGGQNFGLELEDYFVHNSGTGPQPTKNLDGSPRRQVHSRRAHSWLMVFRKVQ